ncbi:MAG: tRNA 2-thiouridine(34) synthase MnmA, partial [Peptococcus niger]
MLNTIALGMSGGVDSSVAVHLLQKAGWKVIGLHLKLTSHT